VKALPYDEEYEPEFHSAAATLWLLEKEKASPEAIAKASNAMRAEMLACGCARCERILTALAVSPVGCQKTSST
jgi:hypothetical protein